jgi:hypothetical protein
MRWISRFMSQTWKFATRTPWVFSVSVLFAFVYLMDVWVLLYRVSWQKIGWPNHHLLIEIPRPPDFSIPILGEPLWWPTNSALWGFTVLTIMWIGSVWIASRNSRARG